MDSQDRKGDNGLTDAVGICVACVCWGHRRKAPATVKANKTKPAILGLPAMTLLCHARHFWPQTQRVRRCH